MALVSLLDYSSIRMEMSKKVHIELLLLKPLRNPLKRTT